MNYFKVDSKQVMEKLEQLLQRFFPHRAKTLQLKLTFVVTVSMLLSLFITMVISITMIHLKARQDIQEFRSESELKIRQNLKNYVDIAYTSIEATYQQA